MLKVDNLKKFFGGVKAVNDCSFEIEKGKITALIGPNGSGKSTVFNLVSGVLEPDSGKIIFKSKSIGGLSINKISNLGISRIFQKPRLFDNLSVLDNLLLAFDNEDQKIWKNLLGLNKDSQEKKDEAFRLLKIVKMYEHQDKLAMSLSYGQKRLIEILRAIINPHQLLMLDEPIAGVTPPLRKKISELLLSLKEEGETILVIEHDMNFVLPISDKVIVMDHGYVIAEDVPGKIKKNKKVLEAYLGK